jgi:hypothetical protein
MRISDTDRTRAVEELRRHCSAGRIDLDGFAERVAEAMAAETLADLDHALRDLPTVRIAEPSGGPVFARRDGGSGGDDGHPGGGGRNGGTRGDRSGDPGDPGDPAAVGRRDLHLRARLVLLLSVVVIAAGACFLVLAQWLWAVLLVAGWVAGVVQGRVRSSRR